MRSIGKWRTAAIFAAMLLAGGVGEAAARGSEGTPSRPGAGPGGGPGGGAGSGGPMVDDEMRAALEQVMRVRLKKILRLTPGQEERVMPRVERLQAARRDFATRRRASISHLRSVMIDETARPAEVEKALREVRGIESSFRGREEHLKEEINAELDPRQQARLYFFEVRFRRDMQRRLLDGAGPGAGRGRGPGVAPPDDPDPDGGGDDDL